MHAFSVGVLLRTGRISHQAYVIRFRLFVIAVRPIILNGYYYFKIKTQYITRVITIRNVLYTKIMQSKHVSRVVDTHMAVQSLFICKFSRSTNDQPLVVRRRTIIIIVRCAQNTNTIVWLTCERSRV